MPLTGPALNPASGNAPESVVIFLHGVGSDGQDLIDLGEMMAGELPNTLFISPNAPTRYDMLPPGMPGGYQWFSLQERTPEKMLSGVSGVTPIVNQFIDEVLAETKLPANKLALVGFSQGTMTSLYIAPRRAEAIAGVVGFSGALIAPETLESEIKSKPDILLIHGEMDDVVPVQASLRAEPVLTAAGINAKVHTRPNLPHSIDPEGIKLCTEFLKARLG